MARDFIEANNIDSAFVTFAAGSILGCFEFIQAMIEFCDKSINIVDPLKKEAAIAKGKKLARFF